MNIKFGMGFMYLFINLYLYIKSPFSKFIFISFKYSLTTRPIYTMSDSLVNDSGSNSLPIFYSIDMSKPFGDVSEKQEQAKGGSMVKTPTTHGHLKLEATVPRYKLIHCINAFSQEDCKLFMEEAKELPETPLEQGGSHLQVEHKTTSESDITSFRPTYLEKIYVKYRLLQIALSGEKEIPFACPLHDALCLMWQKTIVPTTAFHMKIETKVPGYLKAVSGVVKNFATSDKKTCSELFDGYTNEFFTSFSIIRTPIVSSVTPTPTPTSSPQ